MPTELTHDEALQFIWIYEAKQEAAKARRKAYFARPEVRERERARARRYAANHPEKTRQHNARITAKRKAERQRYLELTGVVNAN